MATTMQARRIRIFMACTMLIIMAGAMTYMVKSTAFEKRRQLDRLHAAIAAEQDRIKVLEADWQYHTRPDRIRQLAEDMLALTPPDVGNILTLESLDAAPAQSAPSDGATGGAARRAVPASSPVPATGFYRITTW